jgi:hypothetical protein
VLYGRGPKKSSGRAHGPPAVVYGASAVIGVSGGAACYYLCEEVAVATIGSGSELAQTANVLERAASVVGNQEMRVASEKVAQDAAERFLGEGSKEITQQYGNRVGQVVGRISSDGTKVVRFDGSHYNFVNKLIGGNLHVYF